MAILVVFGRFSFFSLFCDQNQMGPTGSITSENKGPDPIQKNLIPFLSVYCEFIKQKLKEKNLRLNVDAK